jgi:hypothetical protein
MTTKEYIAFLLRNYHKILADIAMLEEEKRTPEKSTETVEEAIEALTFRAQDYGDKVQSGGVSDTTARIAAVYHKEAERYIRIAKTYDRLCFQLAMQKRAADFILDSFTKLKTLLPEVYDCMADIYLVPTSWRNHIEETGTTMGTIVARRRVIIDLFAEWWDGKTLLENSEGVTE